MKKEEFVEKAIKIHGNKYDYSKVEYVNNKTNVCIICPEHGEFWQAPDKHINRKQGCPKCYGNVKKTTDDFINDAIKVHGDEYDYSLVSYINNNTHVSIICKKHGIFKQTPHNHLKGQGCPECGKYKNTRLDTTENFIEKASEVHENKYDYSKVNYTGANNKVKIICPTHGEFEQTPYAHLAGQGCPKCAIDRRWKNREDKITYDKFVERANKIHNGKYSYDKVEFVSMKTPVIIVCPEHGEFEQMPNHHIYGKCGCPKCVSTYQPTNDEFIERVQKIHGNKFDYSKTVYKTSHEKIKIICPIHGEFEQVANYHMIGCGCPKCSHMVSKPEIEITELIKSVYDGEVLTNVRNILSHNRELDIYIPDLKIAIEYNGMVWHSEKFDKGKYYHLNKLEECNKMGIKLIQIYEYEYLFKTEIVKKKILNILGLLNDSERIYARKCVVTEIEKDIAKRFLEINHIQGSTSSSVFLGAVYDNEIVAVMTFKKETKDSDNWELTRFATDIDKRCIGIGGKLLNYFIRKYDPSEIKSFADRRWTVDVNNNLYIKLGFSVDNILDPDYRYTRGQNDYCHKFGFRKHLLLKKYPDEGLSEDMTEYQMTQKLGFYRIWDCGLIKYVWRKS